MNGKHILLFSLPLAAGIVGCGTRQDAEMCDVMARYGAAGIEDAREMIEQGASVNARFAGRNGITCLMAITSVPEAVEMLLESGADPDIRDFDGDTAITSAALAGHAQSVEILIRYGANVNNQSRTGRAYSRSSPRTSTTC